MSLHLESLAKSIDILERSVRTAGRIDDSDKDLQETVRAGLFNTLRLPTSLSWKMIKRWIKEI